MTEPTKATHSESGHEAGGHANFPPFDSSTFPSQLLWLAITFGALYYVMSKIALPKVGAVIENRKARIAKDLNDAAAMQQQADAAAAAHEKTQLALTRGAPRRWASRRSRATSSPPKPTSNARRSRTNSPPSSPPPKARSRRPARRR